MLCILSLYLRKSLNVKSATMKELNLSCTQRNADKTSNDMKYNLFEINERLQNGEITSEQAYKELLVLFDDDYTDNINI